MVAGLLVVCGTVIRCNPARKLAQHWADFSAHTMGLPSIWRTSAPAYTNEAMEKMGNERIRCWNKTQNKNALETGEENCHITEREMVDKSC